MGGKSWTQEEIDILLNRQNLTSKELVKIIERSKTAIQQKADSLGITLADSKYRWGETSVNILKKNYDQYSCKEIADMLGITESAVEMKAFYLGLKKTQKNVWVESDIRYLKENYKKESRKDIAIKLSKNERSIEWQMRKLGLSKSKKKKWNKDDEQFLLKNGNLTYEEAAEKLNRTTQAIKKKCQKTGITLQSKRFEWDETSVNFLVENYCKLSVDDIASKIGASKNSVEMKVHKLGLKKSTDKKWIQSDLNYLVDNKDYKIYDDLAKDLGVSKDAVRAKFKQLNIKYKDTKEKWSEDEINFLKQNGKQYISEELASKLNRSRAMVLVKARELGVKIKSNKFNWDIDSDNFLTNNYLNYDNVWLAEQLNTTRYSVKYRLGKLGLKRPEFTWTEEKDDFLRSNFENVKYQDLADRLGCSKVQIKKRLSKLCLRKNVWTEEQHKLLVDNVGITSNQELVELIGKSFSEVASRIHDKGLQRKEKEPNWTEEEIQYLKDNYCKMTRWEVSCKICRTEMAIQQKARELGLSKNVGLSKKQINYVKKHGTKKQNKEIAEELNVSIFMIKRKKTELKIYRDDIFWNKDEIDFVRDNLDNLTDTELASELGRTEGSINYVISNLITERRKMPYILPEKNIGKILISLLGKENVKTNYNEGTDKPRRIKYPSSYKLQCKDRIKELQHIYPDYELRHPEAGWIPAEYFGFSGEEYEIRKRLKKSFLKHKHGKRFLSFNIEDLRDTEIIKHKLQCAEYLQ